jgi:predicted PurR-regulated permease PerM
MSDTIEISRDTLNRSKTAFDVLKSQLNNDKVEQ